MNWIACLLVIGIIIIVVLRYRHELKSYFSSFAKKKMWEFQFSAVEEQAGNGNHYAEYVLATYYFDGVIVAKSDEEALMYYYRSAEGGYAPAQHMIGGFYHKGLGGLEQNDQAAFAWSIRAAVQGFAPAEFNVGISYLYGYGIEENDDKAAEWFKLAAVHGHAEAQYMLACCFSQGKGVPRSDEIAIQWFQAAANQEHSEAQWVLGMRYKDGIGVAKSLDEACKWLAAAADNGLKKAQDELNKLEISKKMRSSNQLSMLVVVFTLLFGLLSCNNKRQYQYEIEQKEEMEHENEDDETYENWSFEDDGYKDNLLHGESGESSSNKYEESMPYDHYTSSSNDVPCVIVYEGKSGYFVFETMMGYGIMEEYSGGLISEGDELYGEFNSYGIKYMNCSVAFCYKLVITWYVEGKIRLHHI